MLIPQAKEAGPKGVFVGKEIDGFELRQINYLRSELKQGYWAPGRTPWWLPA